MNLLPGSLQDFFEHYSEAVLITKEDNSPVYINPAFAKLTGFNQDSLPSINLKNLFDDSEITDQEKGSRWETVLIKEDKAVSKVSVSLSEIALSDQSKGWVYTIAGNAAVERMWSLLRESERRLTKVKNDLAVREKELARSDEELDQFVYAASHDLQEPLRMITSYIQLLEKKIETGETKNVKEFMKFVLEGTGRMHALITDLLQFSRVNRRGNEFVETDLNELLSVAKAHLANQIKQSEASITADNLPKIKVDSAQIVRLFQNLLDNAIKFRSPERKPEIKISVEEKESEYLFSVKDNGIGIAEKYFDRIFAIFQRLHSRTDFGGTGVGLAVTKKIVERHGGEIWIESEVGKGSTFFFTLKK